MSRERERILELIKIADAEIERLRDEISQIIDVVPSGSSIGKYWAKGNWDGASEGHQNRPKLEDQPYYYQYLTLKNNEPTLPCRKDDSKLTRKIHLGTPVNLNYRDAALLIENTRIKKIKEETLEHLLNHRKALITLLETYLRANNIEDFKLKLELSYEGIFSETLPKLSPKEIQSQKKEIEKSYLKIPLKEHFRKWRERFM